LVVVCLALAAVLGALLVFSSPEALAARSAERDEPWRGREKESAKSTSGHVSDPSLTTKNENVRGKYPTRPLELRDGDTTILAFPPRATTNDTKPLTVVYLHGVHGRAENGCPWLREGASELGWLVCPEANEHLANDTYSWTGSVVEQRAIVARAEKAARAQGADPESAGVLVGFSQGAYVALDLVRAHLGHYRGLVLIGADVTPSHAMLASAGVDRVVFAAGDLDGASAPMQRAADQLRRDGMDARFVSLGRIGHSYETTNKDALSDAIAWVGRST
jgi:predicted esterase